MRRDGRGLLRCLKLVGKGLAWLGELVVLAFIAILTPVVSGVGIVVFVHCL